MELHQLRYFVALAELGNFTHAAKRCFVSQPSLSQQIIKLESELGQRLFDRLGRRAELTAAGLAFLPRARRILLDVDDAARVVREEQSVGRLRFGVIPSAAPYLLPDLLPSVRERLPDLRLEVTEEFRATLIKEVEAGRLEAAVLTTPPPGHHLDIEPLFSEPLLIALPATHSLAGARQLSAGDMKGQPLILLGDSSTLSMQTQRFFGEREIEVDVIGRCAQVKTLKILVAAGLGVAILPKMAAGRDKVPGIVYRELTDTRPTRELFLVRNAERFRSRHENAFVEILREVCRERFGAVPDAPAAPR